MSLYNYIKQVRAIERLSVDHEKTLLDRLHGTEIPKEEALDTLVKHHLYLVVQISLMYRGSRVPIEDLISEGNMALMHGIEAFDPSHGTRISTFVAYRIRAAILKLLQEKQPSKEIIDIAMDKHTTDYELVGVLVSIVDSLSSRHAQVIRLRYGLEDEKPRKLVDVGRIMGLSGERVRQLEESAKEEIRRQLKRRGYGK